MSVLTTQDTYKFRWKSVHIAITSMGMYPLIPQVRKLKAAHIYCEKKLRAPFLPRREGKIIIIFFLWLGMGNNYLDLCPTNSSALVQRHWNGLVTTPLVKQGLNHTVCLVSEILHEWILFNSTQVICWLSILLLLYASFVLTVCYLKNNKSNSNQVKM